MHKENTKNPPILEIIIEWPKTQFQWVDTIIISNFISEPAPYSEIDPLLQALFRYLDQLSLPEASYVTGRSPGSKKSLLKCLILNTYFSIDSLRQLVDILNRFGYYTNFLYIINVTNIVCTFINGYHCAIFCNKTIN